MKFRQVLATFAAAAGWLVSTAARAESPPSAKNLDVSALAASKERLYVGSFDQGLYVLEGDKELRAVVDPAIGPNVNALAWSEHEHELWVGTARGLRRCPRGQACTRIGSDDGVHTVVITTTGAVIAGGDAGLAFVTGDSVRSFGRKDGAPFRSVWALAEAGGRLFVGTTSGLFWGAPAEFSGKHAALGRAAVVLGTLPDDWVTALDYRDDTLFAGTYSAGIVEFRNAAGTPAPAELDGSLGYVNPAGIAALGDECVAVATMDGLALGFPKATLLVPTHARDVTAFVRDPNGGFWIGTRAGVESFAGTCPSRAVQSATER